MGLWGEKGLDEAVTEAALVWHIKCEIKLGVQGALDAFRQNPELVRGYSVSFTQMASEAFWVSRRAGMSADAKLCTEVFIATRQFAKSERQDSISLAS
jgi:hypothetical protein